MMSDNVKPTLNHFHWAMIAIILLATLLRLPWLGAQSIAFDESFSLAVGQADWSTLFRAILSDGVHPPLFYVIHKGALFLWGDAPFGQRFLAAFFSIIGVPLIYWAGRLIFNRRVGLLAALLLALNPLQVWFAQEARMYSLLSVLAIISMALFWQALQTGRRRYWVALAIVNSIIFGVHYFGFLIPVSQLAFIIATFRQNHRQLRPWAVTQMVAFLPLLPWLIGTALRETQSFGIGFLERPLPLDVPLTLWNFTTGWSTYFLGPVSILALVLFAVASINGLRGGQPGFRFSQLLLIFWVFLPLILVWIISQRRAFYADRYLSFIIPGLMLLVAFGAVRINALFWRRLLLAGLVLASVSGLANTHFDPAFFKDDWRGTVSYLEQHSQPEDIILIYNSHLQLPFTYHYHGDLPYQPVTRLQANRPIEPLTTGYRRAWVLYHYGRRPTHYPMQPLRPNGYWNEDPERNPLLADWLEARANDVVDYRHFRGLELWLIALQ